MSINETATVGELLKRVTEKSGLQIDDHFLCFDSTLENSFVPNRNDQLNHLVCKQFLSKILITIFIIRLIHPLKSNENLSIRLL